MNHEVSSVTGRATSGPSGRARALALTAGALLGACGELSGDPQLGTAVGAIANGDAVPNADPARNNVVQVIVTLRDNTQVIGSGIALDEATVVTAAHLVYNFDASIPDQTHAVPPSRVKVFQSVGGTALSVRSVVAHPTYVADQLTIPSPFDRDGVIPKAGVFDLAVLSLSDTIPGAVKLSFTNNNNNPGAFTGSGSFVVMGFGPDPDTSGGQVLRSFVSNNTNVVTPSGYGPTLLDAQETGTNQHIVSEDAGGPALSKLAGDATGGVGNLVGMTQSLKPASDSISRLIFFTSQLQTWIKLVSAAQSNSGVCRSRHIADVPFTIPDDYFASNNGLGKIVFHIEYGTVPAAGGTTPFEVTLAESGALTCGTASSLSFADVTGDGKRDVIVQTGATAVTGIMNIGAGSPPPPPTLTEGKPINNLPKDEDGKNELFGGFDNMSFTGVGGDTGLIGTAPLHGRAYLFAASGSGAATTYSVFNKGGKPQLFFGFPTADGTDGKFVAVISEGLATFAQPVASYYIDLPSTETGLRVDLFDADLSGKNDLGTTGGDVDVMYCLYADGSKTGAKDLAHLVTSIAATTIPPALDAMWTNLIDAAALSDAKEALAKDTLGGDGHLYRLDVVLATSCDSAGTTSTGIANLFKIRTNGQIGVENAEVTFWAGDHDGDFTAFTFASYGDYNFDGNFTFFIDAGGTPGVDLAAAKDLTISDYDADNLSGTPTGVADGANTLITWSLAPVKNPDPQVPEIDPCGPSNISGAYEDTGVPATKFKGVTHGATLTRGGRWTWAWSNVLVTNAVRLEEKVASTPATVCLAKAPLVRPGASLAPRLALAAPDPAAATVGSAQYAMYGADVHRLPMSNAQLASAWTSQVLQGAFSPIVVGSKTSCAMASRRTVMVDARTASAVLGTTATVYDQVVAELTAAKLNIRRLTGRAVDLDEALVYGHPYTVASVISAAELAVAQGRGAVPDAQLVGFLQDLRDINQGEITFNGARAIIPLQGGGDADGDGVIEPIDNCPSRPNPDQRDRNLDGIGDACDPHPVLECIDRRPGGGFTAHFAIDHGGPDVFVARGTDNSVTGTTALPPTHFPPGNAARVFTAASTGADVTWTVLGNPAVATASSPACDALQLADLPLGQQAVLYATDELRIDERAVIADCSDAVSAGATQTFIGAGASVGDVYSQAGVFVGGGGTSVGIVSSAGSVTPQAGARIQAITPLATAPVAPMWSVAFPGGSHPAVSVDAGHVATIAPGSYGAVRVSSQARLNLSPGKYFFDSLQVESAGVMAVNGAAPIQIYIAGGLTFRGQFAAEATPRLAPDLVLAAFGTGAAFVETALRAWLAVPNGQLVLGSGPPVSFTGRFTGRRIEVRSGVTVSLE